MAIYVRNLIHEETEQIKRLVNSRKEPKGKVQRASVIWFSSQKLKTSVIAQKVSLSKQSVRRWIKRFNKHGLSGLQDEPRSGRPPFHTEEDRSRLIALARSKPDELGYPFKLWTIRRLQTTFQEREQIKLSTSTIWTWIRAEGLIWKRQQTWFNVPLDEEFVEKRGP
jgi:transposase